MTEILSGMGVGRGNLAPFPEGHLTGSGDVFGHHSRAAVLLASSG